MRYGNEDEARADPLFRALTIAEVMARTGRTRRTVDRWLKDGRIEPVVLGDGQRVLVERDVVELERDMRKAAEANRQRVRDRAGRPGPRAA